LRFGLLGPLEVARDGELLALGGPRQRALLALLLLHANEVVSRERLIDGLWGARPPETAANALQVAVHGLRRVVGAGRIETRGTGYLVRVERDELDLERFNALVERARAKETAADGLCEALAIWRGEALADLREAPFAAVEAARLEGLRIAALERRIDADLAAGLHADLVAELEALVAGEPLRERFRYQLIVALYRAGRQAEALQAYREARRSLVEELGVEPGPELQRLERAILQQDPALAAPPPRTRVVSSNLPASSTPLVGRQLELAGLTGLLRRGDVRLVTLMGPGGTGKTRLALEAARELEGELADGGVFVDLAPLEDPADVLAAVARALSVGEAHGSTVDSVKEALHDKTLLLLLDNFERVDEAAPVVSDLLAAAPGLQVLATSRAALRLSGEYEFPVPPLRVPGLEDARRLEALGRNEAVSLFAARAQAVRHDFRLTAENAAAVVEICIALEGLPLALELAAARCKQLSPQALAARLGERLDVLTGGPRDRPARQQTLRATIEWSYELLGGPQRELFDALGVFAGGCTLAAAEAVCGAAAEEVEALADRSLVQREEHDGTPRFRMLETVREFAVERLEAHGTAAAAVRRRHADYFTALAEEAGTALWDPVQGPNRAFWLDRLELDYGNLRAALAWADRHDAETELRIAAGLFDFWASRCYFEEGRTWLERALAQAEGVASPVRAKALHAAAFLALDQGDYARCNELGEESLELYRALGDPEGIGRTVHMLGQAAAVAGDRVRAIALAEESLALARELGHIRGIIVSLVQLSGLAAERGDHDRAAALLDEAVSLGQAHGDEAALAAVRLEQSKLAHDAGHFEAASRYAVEGVRLFQVYGTTIGVASGLRRLALLAEAEGRPERTVRLLGAADALHEATGSPPPVDADHEATLDRAREALGAAAYAEAWAAGRALSPQEAVELAARDAEREH